MKKYLISFILFFTLFLLNAQDLKVQFLKGSLAEKTKVVREATVTEGKWITQNALKFINENKNILINDRDFEGFTVATVLSIQNEYVTNLNEEEKNILINQLSQFFVDFDYSDTVQISILSKVSALKDCFSIQPFVNVINEYISDLKNKSSKTNVINVVLDSLNQIGDNNSFKILYNCLFEKQLLQYYPQIESVVVNLIPISMNEVLQLVYCKNFVHIEKIFTLINKNDKISQKSLSEIAENVLNESILLLENSTNDNEDAITKIQMDCVKILESNNWTKASKSLINYFGCVKELYNSSKISEVDFISVIKALESIAPLDAIKPLTNYLVELNSRVEQNQEYSEQIALAVVNTLGAIGDKAAFDSLLSVTYLTYPESVLAAARNALAKLKW